MSRIKHTSTHACTHTLFSLSLSAPKPRCATKDLNVKIKKAGIKEITWRISKKKKAKLAQVTIKNLALPLASRGCWTLLLPSREESPFRRDQQRRADLRQALRRDHLTLGQEVLNLLCELQLYKSILFILI